MFQLGISALAIHTTLCVVGLFLIGIAIVILFSFLNKGVRGVIKVKTLEEGLEELWKKRNNLKAGGEYSVAVRVIVDMNIGANNMKNMADTEDALERNKVFNLDLSIGAEIQNASIPCCQELEDQLSHGNIAKEAFLVDDILFEYDKYYAKQEITSKNLPYAQKNYVNNKVINKIHSTFDQFQGLNPNKQSKQLQSEKKQNKNHKEVFTRM